MAEWTKALKVAFVCIAATFLTGCWDYQKINDRAQIIGIAVDPVENNPDRMSFTLQVPSFDEQGGGAQAGGEGGPSGAIATAQTFKNITVQAEGLSSAITRAQMYYDKMFQLGNLQTVVLNTSLTSKQVQRTVSEMVRNQELDKLAWLLFSEEPAKDVFKSGETGAPADVIDRFLGANLKQHAFTTRTRLWEFWRDMRSYGIEPHTGLVRATPNGIQVYGAFFCRGSTPSIKLSPADTVFFNLLSDRVQHLALWVPDGKKRFELISTKSKRKMWVTMNGRIPQLHVRIRADTVVAADESAGDLNLTSTGLKHYEDVTAGYMQQGATRVLKRFQAQGLDPFGFGMNLLTRQPQTLAFVKQTWPKAFSNAALDVRVEVIALRKGGLM